MATPCSSCGVQAQIQEPCGSCGSCHSGCKQPGCLWNWCALDIDCTPAAKHRRVSLEDIAVMNEIEKALELDEPRDGSDEADESSDDEDETLSLLIAVRAEADALHRLVNTAASLAERDRLHAEVTRVLGCAAPDR